MSIPEFADIIAQVRADDVARYVRSLGWEKQESVNKKILEFKSPQTLTNDNGMAITLILPCDTSFADYHRVVRTAIERLALSYKMPIFSVAERIKNQFIDIFKQRISIPHQMTNLPLTVAAEIINLLRELISYSACAEEAPAPYFAKARKIGRQYTEKCRFGHTFYGSFGISIEMPLPNVIKNLLVDSEERPIERRIIERVINGLQLSVKAKNEGDMTLIKESYKNAFNANQYEIMGKMTEVLKDYDLGYSVNWSPNYKVIDEKAAANEIIIKSSEYLDFFNSAAKSLRDVRESLATEINGKIIQLKAFAPDEDDGDEADDISDADREIVIHCDIDGTKRKIHAILSRDDYMRACDAHKDGKNVGIRGLLEKIGKKFQLTNPSDFEIISSNR